MLYEILQDGFHTPLTKTQVAELFAAGRIHRHTRCRPAGAGQSRTVDELFPLLKYHAPWQFAYQLPETNNEFRFRRVIVAGTSVAIAAAAVLIAYFCLRGETPAAPRIATIAPIRSPRAQSGVWLSHQHSPTPSTPSQVVVSPPEQPRTLTRSDIRLAEAQRIAEQARRDQALAEQQRALHEQMLREQEKAAGRNEHVPLDQLHVVNVGGESVTLMIHDNDVTSFDLWMHGAWHRQIPKQKGLTGSQTDETLIYSNGRAALYYVWEISGRINHCLLRVRDA